LIRLTRAAAIAGGYRTGWCLSKGGLKRSVATEDYGIPLGIAAAGANRHDSPLLAPTLQAAADQLSGVLPDQRTCQKPGAGSRANAIMERWIGGCRRELLDRTLIWNQCHLLRVLRDYETHHNEHRPHRSLDQAAPLKPLPNAVADLDAFSARRRDLIGGVIHEYAQVA